MNEKAFEKVERDLNLATGEIKIMGAKGKNTTEVCLAAGGVKPPKSIIRLCHHGFAPANIVTAPSI